MVNVSEFIKNNVPLCVCTLGIAIVGYLGYHAVRWIINKCQKTEKVDHVVKKNIHKPKPSHVPKSLINRVNKVEISLDKITMGQGEYIVFHQLPNGEKKELARETFEEVYKILTQYSPSALMNSKSDKAAEECVNRYELIKAKVKEIDQSLEVVFIPRTLYELVFIRKCIKEDLKHKKICSSLEPSSHKIELEDFEGDQQKYEAYLKNKELKQIERKCWHLCYFTDPGDNQHAGVKDVAYRLNQVMVKILAPSNDGFTHQEFSKFAEKEIEFLKAHYRKGLEVIERKRKGEKVEDISSCTTPGPTTNFGFESTRGSIKPMGIRNDADAQIIKDAITLDCSKLAQKSFFLYRGTDFQKDSIASWSDKDQPYSLSYGTSLFAGCLYDGGATAFHYMRNGQDAYAVPVPFDQLNDSPFYVPSTNTVAQLFGDGEIFHGRTKIWKDYDVRKIGGMNIGANGHQREHLKSNLTKDEITAKFQEYKNKAIQLK